VKAANRKKDAMPEPTTELPDVPVGARFVVVGWDRLPPVELVQKLHTSWRVAEIKPDGTVDRARFRVSKRNLVGRTVRILPRDFKPDLSPGGGREAPAQDLQELTVPARLEAPVPTPSAGVVPSAPQERILTRAEYQRLSDVPPDGQWLANIQNKHTQRA
jgi:hypothetical protein